MPSANKYKGGRRRRARRMVRKNMRKTLSGVGQMVKFKETFSLGGRAVNVNQSPLQFKLTDLGQIAQYQALYKTYKLTGVKVTFIPGYASGDINQATANINAGFTQGGIIRLVTSITRGACQTMGSELAVLQKQHKFHTFSDGKPYSIYIPNPVVAVDVDTAGGLTNNSLFKTGFLDLASAADVNHNGLEFYLSSSGNSTSGVNVYATYYFTAKTAQ